MLLMRGIAGAEGHEKGRCLAWQRPFPWGRQLYRITFFLCLSLKLCHPFL
jgi:hypothetical protein